MSVFLATAIIAITAGYSEAVFTIKPAIALSEEYDDNIYLQDNRVSDFITRVMPSVKMEYRAPVWEWDFNYMLNWAYYARLGESYDSNNARLASRAKLIQNFLYFDVYDVYENVVTNPRNPSTETNLVQNRTDSNTLTASPYIRYQLTPSAVLATGYRYTNIWYREDNGVNRQLHTGFVMGEYKFSPLLRALAGAEYTEDMPDGSYPDNKQTVLYIKTFYKIGQRTDFDGTLGYRWINFEGTSDRDRILYNAGIVYRISEKGQIEFRAASGVAALPAVGMPQAETLAEQMNAGVSLLYSPSLGVYESRTEQITIRYGETLSINGSIFHRKDTYFETEEKDHAYALSIYGSIFHRKDTYFETEEKDHVYGVTAGLQYQYSPRLTFRIGGRYEKDHYNPKDEKRTIYNGTAGIDYQLKPKATLTLTYNHTREDGNTRDLDYTDNVIAVQLRMTF